MRFAYCFLPCFSTQQHLHGSHRGFLDSAGRSRNKILDVPDLRDVLPNPELRTKYYIPGVCTAGSLSHAPDLLRETSWLPGSK